VVTESTRPKVGLVMAGGGARAAYQVGVLKAVAELLPAGTSNPFPILSGTSAGAINAAALAAYALDFHDAVRRLNYIWRNFRVQRVFRADAAGVAASGARWLAALMLGGLGKRNPQALLDRTPLAELLERYLPMQRIQGAIDAGALHAVSVTATGYSTGQSVSFFQGADTIAPWQRARRVGSAAQLTIEHLLASSAIPFVFTAVKLNREYFGDGSLRQIAPISPALHLGAERLLVIGVRYESGPSAAREHDPPYPSLAQVAGHVLNSIFLDSLEADLERLQRINRTVGLIPPQQRIEHGVMLRQVEALVISPSQDIERIAARHAHRLPRPVRFLLRGIGAGRRAGANLVSYLLFEKPYCRELISLGYADAMMRREELLRFLGVESRT
jgi:NTE family protein